MTEELLSLDKFHEELNKHTDDLIEKSKEVTREYIKAIKPLILAIDAMPKGQQKVFGALMITTFQRLETAQEEVSKLYDELGK